MERVALFADAGYVLVGAHDVLGGPTSRSAFDCNYEALVPALAAQVQAHTGGVRMLRTYWYDGARDRLPTAEHRRIGSLPYVKVRLGSVNAKNQQKGVDFLIYRDLTTLARSRAIDRAYLFAGDEDLRESVADAQDMGIQVVLMTFEPTARTGRSAALVREVDEVLTMSDKEFWAPHFAAPKVVARATAPTNDELQPCADEFARAWTRDATPEEITKLLEQEPEVPRHLYVQLVLAAEASLGSLRPFKDAKGELRSLFFAAVKRHRDAVGE